MSRKQTYPIAITAAAAAITAFWMLAHRGDPSPSLGTSSANVGTTPAVVTRLADRRAMTSEIPNDCSDDSSKIPSGEHRFMPVQGPDGMLGFATPLTDDADTRLRALLPSTGDRPIRFGVGPSGEIGVRNLGMYGPARTEGTAVVYGTDLGASHWSSSEHGVEEWLHIDVPRDGIVAEYELEGAYFVATAEGASVRDDAGVTWLDVKAPAAWDADRRAVGVWLEVIDDRLAVVIDAPDDARGPLVVDPFWETSDDIGTGRQLHTATRLLDGRVLVAGGIDEATFVSNVAEIYDPSTGSWSTVAPLPFPIRSHAQVLLNDGRVLLSHGRGSGIPDGTQAALYDPILDSWAIADPGRANIGGPATRVGQRSTLLPDGKVLLSGAFCCTGREAHVYDPATDEFHVIANMQVHRLAHSLTVLRDGSVLAAGGGTLNPSGLNSNTAELYVPDGKNYLNGSWIQLPNMNAGHFDHQAVLLEDGPNAGKVLICTGIDGSTIPDSFFFTSACDMYDPDTQTFAVAPSIPHSRQRSGTFNGGDFLARVESGPSTGKVVVAGGWPATPYTDVYDPFTNTWTTECQLQHPRLRHHTTALFDGSVLVVGGQTNPSSQALRSVERLYLTSYDDDDCDGIPNAADICPMGGCGMVMGMVYSDESEDCDPTGDTGVFGVQIRATNAAGETRYGVTNFDGEYLLELPNGTWDISVVDSQTIELAACGGPGVVETVEVWGGFLEGPGFLMGPGCEGTINIDSHNPDPTNNNNPNCHGGPYWSPCLGIDWEYCFDVHNSSSTIWSAASLTVTLPQGMTYISSDLDSTECNITEGDNDSGTVTYNLVDIPSNRLCRVCIEVSVESNIPSDGWTVLADLEGTCGQDMLGAGRTLTTPDECSCDPNDKSVYPLGCDEAGTITEPQPLTYTVRFQNTGLGPAHDVRIVDPIDVDLDLESLVLRGASHPISNVQVDGDRRLFVRFDDIELPAAIDDPIGSNGYIQLDLSPAESSLGTEYTNMAEIYFDQNEVVITNEVLNTAGTCP